MNKKFLLSLGVALAVVASVAAMSAYEAHVINVTAHIENALSVSTKAIDFGTVFPQEWVEESFTISMSQSFLTEGKADDIEYVINQKPKCICDDSNQYDVIGYCTEGKYAPVNYYSPHDCPVNYVKMLDLCRFLSKEDGDPDDQNDVEVPSYFLGYVEGCTPVAQHTFMQAMGRLAKSQNDETDTWIVDLKVPPVDGYIGQDWPETCAEWVVPQDSQDYGCDLWVEVTGISRVPEVDEGMDSIALENKNEDGWFVLIDNIMATLVFETVAETFNYTLIAQGLVPTTNYSFIYYADGWPGNNPGALIGSGTSDASGDLTLSDNVELGMDLPDSADANYPGGAKIWLVLSTDYNASNKSMTAWNPTQYLYEYNVIKYDDTGES